MKNKLTQNYGPIFNAIPELSELKKYLHYSEQAFIITQELAGNDAKDWDNPAGKILSFLNFHALNTSYSVRLLTTYVQTLEAYGLLRIRLEQFFVCSYLINAEYEDGFQSFIEDINRTDHRYAQSIKNINPSLFSILEKIFPGKLENAKEKAFLNEKILDPDFDFENDKIKRKWTKLNTYDLCLHRDKLIDKDDPISSIKLQNLYLSIYKSASIFIHSETGILTENFVQIENGQVGPNSAYIFSNLVNIALIDIVQCYEVLKFIKPGKVQKLVDLYHAYKKDIESDYKLIFEN